jgi:hypothetical protein
MALRAARDSDVERWKAPRGSAVTCALCQGMSTSALLFDRNYNVIEGGSDFVTLRLDYPDHDPAMMQLMQQMHFSFFDAPRDPSGAFIPSRFDCAIVPVSVGHRQLGHTCAEVRYSHLRLGALGMNKFGIFDRATIRSVLTIQFRILHGHLFAAMCALAVL